MPLLANGGITVLQSQSLFRRLWFKPDWNLTGICRIKEKCCWVVKRICPDLRPQGEKEGGWEGTKLIFILPAEIQRLGNISSITTKSWLTPFYAPFCKAVQEEEKIKSLFSPCLYSFSQVVTSHWFLPYKLFKIPPSHWDWKNQSPWLKSDQLHISKCLSNLLIMSGYRQHESQRSREMHSVLTELKRSISPSAFLLNHVAVLPSHRTACRNTAWRRVSSDTLISMSCVKFCCF